MVNKWRKLASKLSRLLTVRGWKIRPKVWIEKKDVESNQGYFPRKEDLSGR